MTKPTTRRASVPKDHKYGRQYHEGKPPHEGTYAVMYTMKSHRPTCEDCGENLEGDGHQTALRCPYTDQDHSDREPDANPLYCGYTDEGTHNDQTS